MHSFLLSLCSADVNAIDNFMWTPLHHCAHSGQVCSYESQYPSHIFLLFCCAAFPMPIMVLLYYVHVCTYVHA